VVFETGAGGALTASHVYAGNRLVASLTAAAGLTFYHHDKTGNVLALTDAGGSVTGAFAYTPYGSVSDHDGVATPPFTAVGAYGVMDEGNDIFFMRNRFYDASTGRFLQRDPIGFSGGANPYVYLGNNPVDRIDPLGLIGSDEGFDRLARSIETMTPTQRKYLAILGTTAAFASIATLAAAEACTVGAAVGTTPAAEAAAVVDSVGMREWAAYTIDELLVLDAATVRAGIADEIKRNGVSRVKYLAQRLAVGMFNAAEAGQTGLANRLGSLLNLIRW
jgi:RHS repeat-associated protein